MDEIYRILANLFWPRFCIVCGKPITREHLCDQHYRELKNLETWQESEVKIGKSTKKIVSIFEDDPLTNLVLTSLKNKKRLADISKFVDKGRITRELPGKSWAVVPSDPLRRFNIGQEPLYEILNSLHTESPVNYFRHGIKRKLFSKKQQHLSKERRKENAKKLFAANHNDQYTDCKVWVFDDFITTGKTAEYFTRSLESSGVVVSGLLTLMSVQRN